MKRIYVYQIDENRETYLSYCSVYQHPDGDYIIVLDENESEFVGMHPDYKMVNVGLIE